MPYSDPARQAAYQNAWMQRRRAEWIAEHGPCVDCGAWEQLQVDHANAATKITHRVWSWAEGRRDAELAKCVVRCEPCHKVKTTVSGEHARGRSNGATKLAADQIREIRRLPSVGHTELGRRFGVDESTIRAIRSGHTWAHLT